MNKKLLKFVVCPRCKGELVMHKRTALLCSQCNLLYPVRDGVPVLLEMDASVVKEKNR